MKKRLIVLLGLGLTLMIVPFLINIYSIFRIISLVLGIILITVSLCLKKKRNIFYIILVPLIMLVFSYGIDTLLFYTLKRVPVFSYAIKSSDKMRTYNSFFYRVFDCNGNLTLDYGYTKNYVCSNDCLDAININSFMQDAEESFKKYHHKFVHIYGKISKITGNENIELASFTQGDDTLNGYVNFNLNNILIVNTDENLSKYRIYDYVDVYGKVTSINDGKITLTNTKLVASDIYDTYSFEIIASDDNKLTNLVKEKDYYYYGLNTINVKYDGDNIYELSYLLTDDRFKFDDLIKGKEYEVFKNDEDVEIAKKYKLEKFDLLECSNGKKIVANSKSKANQSICDLELD
ncbi:hypothetical protein EGP99_05790 [bacterium]|nr:hypothetical protein [bacterium]